MSTELYVFLLFIWGFVFLIIGIHWYKYRIKKIKVNPPKYSYVKYRYLYVDDYSKKDAKEGDKEELRECVERIRKLQRTDRDEIITGHHFGELLWLLKNNKYKLEENEVITIKKEIEVYLGVGLGQVYNMMEILALANKYKRNK